MVVACSVLPAHVTVLTCCRSNVKKSTTPTDEFEFDDINVSKRSTEVSYIII